MKAMLLILLLLITTPAFALQNEFLLRVGMEMVSCLAKGEIESESSSNKVYSLGIAAYYSRIFTRWELGLSTHIYAGALEDFYLAENGETLTGDGTLFSQSYSVFTKRFFELYPIKYWRLYLLGGPSFIFNTIKLRNFTTSTPEFTHNHKVTSEAVGVTLAIGIEENALKKESRPNYFQISYSAHRPTKFSIIDATDFTKVESVYQSNTGRNVIIHTIMIEAGFLIF